MRVVLDTNVPVSALLNPRGAPAQLVALAISGRLTCVYDTRISGEYRAVLGRPRFAFAPEEIRKLIEALEAGGELIAAEPLGVLLPDPGDVSFAEVAVTGAADALVTGNARHFVLPDPLPVPVWSPAEFLRRWPE